MFIKVLLFFFVISNFFTNSFFNFLICLFFFYIFHSSFIRIVGFFMILFVVFFHISLSFTLLVFLHNIKLRTINFLAIFYTSTYVHDEFAFQDLLVTCLTVDLFIFVRRHFLEKGKTFENKICECP